MNKPKYAKEHCYEILCGLANRMGVEVIYRNSIPEPALAFADAVDTEGGRKKLIIMPENDEKILLAGKNPSAVLAHEITHYLVEDFYHDDPIINMGTSFPLRLMLENDCDRMGLAIYLLAEAIASEEDEAVPMEYVPDEE